MKLERYLPAAVRRRYVAKLALGFSLVALAVLATSAVMVAQTGAVVGDEVRVQHEANALDAAHSIGSWLDAIESTGRALVHADAFDSGDSDAVSGFLITLMEQGRVHETVNSVHYVDTTDGTILASSAGIFEGRSIDGFGFPSTDDLSFDGDGRVVSNAFRSPTTTKPAVAVATPVPDQPDRALLVVADLTSVSANLPQRSNASFVKVVNDRGTVVVSHNTSELLAQNMGSANQTGVESMAVERGLSGESGYTRMDMGGVDMTMGYAPVEDVAWAVMYHQPASAAFALKSSVFWYLLLLIGVGFVGLLLVGGLVARSAVRPLNRLTDRASTIESGDLDVEIESDRVDEFGQLFDSVDGMRETLRERLAAAESAEAEAQAASERAQSAQAEAEALVEHLQAKADAFSSTMAAGADGDLTVRMDPESESDAMTDIAEGFNEMMASLETVVGSVHEFAAAVRDSTDDVADNATEVRDASREMAETIEGVVDSTEQQAEKLGATTEEMTDLSATIEEVASSTAEAADQSQTAARRGDEGSSQAAAAIEQMADIEATAADVREAIDSLDAEMARIGEIADLIDEIAEQTNMLALNANIEAARAGTGAGADGDGFAVVAEEVKALAEETTERTGEIEARIEEVTEATGAVADDIRDMETQIGEGKSTVAEAVETLEAIVDAVEEANRSVQAIDDATDEQAASVEEAVAMIEDVDDIAASTAAEAEDVAAATEEQTAAIESVTDEIGAVAERADRLAALVDQFEVGTDLDHEGHAAGDDPAAADD